VAQLVVVVQVLVTQRLPVDALRHQGLDLMHDILGGTPVTKAARHRCGQAHGPVGLPQQQRSGIGCRRPALEIGHNLAASEPFKNQLSVATVCRHRLSPSDQSKRLVAQPLSLIPSADALTTVRNPG
jgi:hypothetical protein